MTPNALAQLQGLKAWDQERQKASIAPAVPATAPTPRRQTNRELLATVRSHENTERVRDRAAETLRRQIKTLCAATLARQSRLLTANELEDLTQEVLVRLLQSPENTDPSPAYIARVATNLLIDRQRHLVRRGQEKQTLSLDDTVEGTAAREVADPEARVEETVLSRIQQRSLREALLTFLKPNEALVVLRRAEGASHDEIAQELGTNAACVRKQAERGLKRLREHAEAGRLAVA